MALDFLKGLFSKKSDNPELDRLKSEEKHILSEFIDMAKNVVGRDAEKLAMNLPIKNKLELMEVIKEQYQSVVSHSYRKDTTDRFKVTKDIKMVKDASSYFMDKYEELVENLHRQQKIIKKELNK